MTSTAALFIIGWVFSHTRQCDYVIPETGSRCEHTILKKRRQYTCTQHLKMLARQRIPDQRSSEPGFPGPRARPTPPRHQPGSRELDHRKRSTPSAKISSAAYDVAAEVLTDAWKETVAKHLASALDDELWQALARGRRNSGLCPLLAEAADLIDQSGSVLKKSAGWAVQKVLRVLHRSRLEQRIARAIVEQALPTVFESQVEVAARSLRIVGIWLCLVERRPLRGCMCWQSLVKGRTEDVIRLYLERELTDLARVNS